MMGCGTKTNRFNFSHLKAIVIPLKHLHQCLLNTVYFALPIVFNILEWCAQDEWDYSRQGGGYGNESKMHLRMKSE